jgi:predicted MPP superfamily phosphohydrolase
MKHAFLLIATAGALSVLVQWFSFVSIRKYLFGRYRPIGRKVAYSALACIAGVDYLLITLTTGSALVARGSAEQKIAGIVFFTFLGVTIAFGLFLIVPTLLNDLWRLKEIFGKGIRASGSDADSREPVPPAESPRRRIAEESDSSMVSRRSFLKWTTAAGLTCTTGLAGYGLAEAYGKPVVEEFDVVHPALEGLRGPIVLIQVSDFHFGLFFGTSELEKLVDRLNAIDADALVITGDVFHSPLAVKRDAARVLTRLRSRGFGNFAVLGNHDFYAGGRESAKYIEKGGIRLLREEWTTLTQGDVRIHLGGIDDPMGSWLFGKEFPNFRVLAAKAPRDPGMRILLSHRPAVLPFASRADIDLVLAGHIHGGQIIIPFPGRERGLSPADLVSQYTHGWYREGSSRLYLNRGVGLTFLPWRINCRPEITVFRLKPFSDRKSDIGDRKALLP